MFGSNCNNEVVDGMMQCSYRGTTIKKTRKSGAKLDREATQSKNGRRYRTGRPMMTVAITMAAVMVVAASALQGCSSNQGNKTGGKAWNTQMTVTNGAVSATQGSSPAATTGANKGQSQQLAENVLMSDYDRSVFWAPENVLGSSIARVDITSITFLDSLNGMPGDAWDVSADANGKVMAWVKGGDLYIGAEGGVAANEDCCALFSGYTNAREISFGNNFHTENTTDMSAIFSGCSSLTELDVSGFNTSQVTNMGGMFSFCDGLTELDVSGFDTSHVTNMSSMFDDCENLTELDLSGFDTSQVTRMAYMFACCENLTELNVSGFDTSQVTKMAYMFRGCENLTKLDVSGFDTSQVDFMPGMFMNCKNLQFLDLSGFVCSSEVEVLSMLYGCDNLAMPDLSQFNDVQIENMWFH